MIVHLNGELIPAERAAISPFDRGFVFGDGVYEGLRTFAGRLVAVDRHISRMDGGLAEARIRWDASRLGAMSLALAEANHMPDAFVYWQVTRGTPRPGQPVRSRVPTGSMPATVFGFCTPQPELERFATAPTCTASVRQDTRWTRGHLKSTSMLGNVLAAIEAAEQGAHDAVLVRDGLVAEGTCANVVLAVPTREGGTELVTPSLESVSILAGVTRALLLEDVPQLKERAVRVEELFQATEIMLVGTTAMVTSVVRLDDRPVGTGLPGSVAGRLLGSLVGRVARECGLPLPGAARAEAARAETIKSGAAGEPAILNRCPPSQAVA